jgi:trk system potassium uptake protein TrkH
MASLPPGQRALAALFQSTTARTAGFNTVSLEPGAISPGNHFLLCILMFIGGSPGGTAGGVKTVTATVMLLAVLAALRRRENVEVLGRTIPAELVRRAATVITVCSLLVSGAVLLLGYTESAGLLEVMFETVSAFGTVGLSTGLTPHLTAFGRGVIIVLMFAGRIGPLTLLIALAGRRRAVRYEYPIEPVIMG